MTIKEKRFLKFSQQPKDTSLDKTKIVLEDFGYELSKIKGSHHVFKKPYESTIVIPVHNNKVKKIYIKKLIKILNESPKL